MRRLGLPDLRDVLAVLGLVIALVGGYLLLPVGAWLLIIGALLVLAAVRPHTPRS